MTSADRKEFLEKERADKQQDLGYASYRLAVLAEIDKKERAALAKEREKGSPRWRGYRRASERLHAALYGDVLNNRLRLVEIAETLADLEDSDA